MVVGVEGLLLVLETRRRVISRGFTKDIKFGIDGRGRTARPLSNVERTGRRWIMMGQAFKKDQRVVSGAPEALGRG